MARMEAVETARKEQEKISGKKASHRRGSPGKLVCLFPM